MSSQSKEVANLGSYGHFRLCFVHTHTDRPKKPLNIVHRTPRLKVCCHTCGASLVPYIVSTSNTESSSNHLSHHRQKVQRKSLGSSRPQAYVEIKVINFCCPCRRERDLHMDSRTMCLPREEVSKNKHFLRVPLNRDVCTGIAPRGHLVTWRGVVWLRFAWLGLAWLGSARFVLVWFGRFGLTRLGLWRVVCGLVVAWPPSRSQ